MQPSELARTGGDPAARGVSVLWRPNAAVCWNGRLRPRGLLSPFPSLPLALAVGACLCSRRALISLLPRPAAPQGTRRESAPRTRSTWAHASAGAFTPQRWPSRVTLLRCVAGCSCLWVPMTSGNDGRLLKRVVFSAVRAKRVVCTHS